MLLVGCVMAVTAMAIIYTLVAAGLLKLVAGLLFVLAFLFLIDLVYCKIASAWSRFQRSSTSEVDARSSETITKLKPAVGETFEQMIMCDSSQVDDPLHPHVSLIYMISVTKHASFWRTFTIWRVSTVTGRREYVYHFNLVEAFPFLSDGQFRVSAFCSQNAVFVHICRDREYAYLFVYDVRHKKSAKCHMARPLDSYSPIAILCLGRHMERGTVDGWHIRLLGTASSNPWPSRFIVTNFTIDLSASDPSSYAIITQEHLPIPYAPQPARVRSQNQFGVVVRSYAHCHIFVYHAELKRFQMFHTFRDFTDSDSALTNIRQRYHTNFNPMVLNAREVMQATTSSTTGTTRVIIYVSGCRHQRCVCSLFSPPGRTSRLWQRWRPITFVKKRVST